MITLCHALITPSIQRPFQFSRKSYFVGTEWFATPWVFAYPKGKTAFSLSLSLRDSNSLSLKSLFLPPLQRMRPMRKQDSSGDWFQKKDSSGDVTMKYWVSEGLSFALSTGFRFSLMGFFFLLCPHLICGTLDLIISLSGCWEKQRMGNEKLDFESAITKLGGEGFL